MRAKFGLSRTPCPLKDVGKLYVMKEDTEVVLHASAVCGGAVWQFLCPNSKLTLKTIGEDTLDHNGSTSRELTVTGHVLVIADTGGFLVHTYEGKSPLSGTVSNVLKKKRRSQPTEADSAEQG